MKVFILQCKVLLCFFQGHLLSAGGKCLLFRLERSPGEHPALGTRGRQSRRWSCSARNGTVSYDRSEETLELPREPGRTRYQERFIQWLLPSTCPFSPRHPWPDVSVLQRDKQPPAAGSLSSPLISTTGQNTL